ncbi:60S ribosomal protein L22 [Wickerhamiella sorbophila]|uniref:60S ribosomal protein L22 n=1 Tax=Wickerhamiella sorbophila TaxID=45607 RepID=A0A2T0FID7_9ASCO|nr:60S ribosomal protein L22 [Wickerhamiella sorbophila]PRT54758.1 60S ribosomal protein L22 [Wickerhamiella sorbophila]
MAPVKSKKASKQAKKIVLDATNANAETQIFDVEAFVKYLKEHIKVEGRTGQLEDKVTVASSGNKVTVTSTVKFSGKYAKYLTKRFLKKNELRDWLRVVATTRGVYEIRFFNLSADEEEEEEEEEDEEDEE